MTMYDTNQGGEGDTTRLEKLISRLEVFGLNAARLILAVTITLAVIGFVLGLLGLAVQGFLYERATNTAKYRIDSISFTPQFSNLLVSGKPQMDPDGAINHDRVAAARKTREELISDRQADMREAGICFGSGEDCRNPEFQRNKLENNWESASVYPRIRNGSVVSYATTMRIPQLAGYYGAYGFTDQEDSLKSEWDAIHACLTAYKAKNGNLYFQKAPELYDATVTQCDVNYLAALRAELNSRPANWSLADSLFVAGLRLAVMACGITIILIALTIIFFRLEVSFRALRNLDRLP